MANKSFQKGLVVASLAGGVEGTFPEGEIEITENGEYDVTAYETATVNVAGGGGEIGSRDLMANAIIKISAIVEESE